MDRRTYLTLLSGTAIIPTLATPSMPGNTPKTNTDPDNTHDTDEHTADVEFTDLPDHVFEGQTHGITITVTNNESEPIEIPIEFTPPPQRTEPTDTQTVTVPSNDSTETTFTWNVQQGAGGHTGEITVETPGGAKASEPISMIAPASAEITTITGENTQGNDSESTEHIIVHSGEEFTTEYVVKNIGTAPTTVDVTVELHRTTATHTPPTTEDPKATIGETETLLTDREHLTLYDTEREGTVTATAPEPGEYTVMVRTGSHVTTEQLIVTP